MVFCELEWGNALEVPTAAKRHDLEAQLATEDVGRAVASDTLKEGFNWLVVQYWSGSSRRRPWTGRTKTLVEIEDFTAANVVLHRARRGTRSCQLCWCLSMDG